MARDPRIEEMLMQWAEAVTVGDGSGYSTMSVLHEDWMPPSPGVMPTLKVGCRRSAREMHTAISTLSMRLSNTIVVHYCLRLPMVDQAERLGCSVSTVHMRIDKAHVLLRAALKKGV